MRSQRNIWRESFQSDYSLNLNGTCQNTVRISTISFETHKHAVFGASRLFWLWFSVRLHIPGISY